MEEPNFHDPNGNRAHSPHCVICARLYFDTVGSWSFLSWASF